MGWKDLLGKVFPAKQLQEELGLYAENAPEIALDIDFVPEELHEIVPHANKWGVGDDVIRLDIIQKATDEEKWAFIRAMKDKTDAVRDFADRDDVVPEVAEPLVNMLTALAEIGVWPDTRVLRLGDAQPRLPDDAEIAFGDVEDLSAYETLGKALISDQARGYDQALQDELAPWARQLGADTVTFEHHTPRRLGAGEAVLLFLRSSG